MKVRIIGIAAVAAMTVATTHAAINTWTAGASGNWTNTANWSLGFVPGAADYGRFSGTGDGTTIDTNVGSIYRLEVGHEATGATLELNTGGVLSVNQFRIGANNSTDSGTMNINGGALTIAGGTHGIGYQGTGVVNLNSGSFISTGDLAIGRSQDSSGTMNMSGGTLGVTGVINLGGVTAGGLPSSTGVTGAFNLSGGTVTASKINVGKAGDGELTITGGNMTVATFRAESFDGMTGVINLTGGTVVADKVEIGPNGTLNLATAATLTNTDMAFEANGLLVWEGDQTTVISDMVTAGELSWISATATYDDARAYDQEFLSGGQYLRSAYNSGTGETQVWTVIPEPATLWMIVTMGGSILFIRHRLVL